MTQLRTLLITLVLMAGSAYAIESDKLYHVGAGAVVMGSCLAIGTHSDLTNSEAKCLMWTVLAGLAKEWVDSAGFGTPDFNDVTATAFGGVLVDIPVQFTK